MHTVLVDLVELALEYAGLTQQRTLRAADSLREASERDAVRVIGEAEEKAERMIQQALSRMSETEQRIRELRMERRNFHIKFQGMLDLFQQVLKFDKEEDEMEASIAVHRPKRREGEAG